MSGETQSVAALELLPNRVRRTYSGGSMIDRLRGRAAPCDTDRPEEWIASTVAARNAGMAPEPGEGLSVVRRVDGTEIRLADLIAADPSALLGARHVSVHGPSLGLLTKLLDAAERLTIQVHPDPHTAAALFHSRYGKTEAWYVLGGRAIGGRAPHVLVGFKPGVTRAAWQGLFERQDIAGMIAALHEISVQPGDVILLPGGVPHAIGAGCFLLELQEPTDLTIRVERTTPGGRKINDELCHQGVGFEAMFDCFHYEGLELEEVLRRQKVHPRLIAETAAYTKRSLIDAAAVRFFSLDECVIRTEMPWLPDGGFALGVLVDGTIEIKAEGNAPQLRCERGTSVIFPAGRPASVLRSVGAVPARLLVCRPPRVDTA